MSSVYAGRLWKQEIFVMKIFGVELPPLLHTLIFFWRGPDGVQLLLSAESQNEILRKPRPCQSHLKGAGMITAVSTRIWRISPPPSLNVILISVSYLYACSTILSRKKKKTVNKHTTWQNIIFLPIRPSITTCIHWVWRMRGFFFSRRVEVHHGSSSHVIFHFGVKIIDVGLWHVKVADVEGLLFLPEWTWRHIHG